MMKLIDMRKARQFGILLIIIGTFIPSILYPFTSLTSEATATKVAYAMKGVLYDTNLKYLEVVLVKGEWKDNKKGYEKLSMEEIQAILRESEQDPSILGSSKYSNLFEEEKPQGRLAIPYRYTIAFGILLAFIGIAIVALYRNKKGTD